MVLTLLQFEAINKFDSLSQDYILKLNNAKEKVEYKTDLDIISKSWLEIIWYISF